MHITSIDRAGEGHLVTVSRHRPRRFELASGVASVTRHHVAVVALLVQRTFDITVAATAAAGDDRECVRPRRRREAGDLDVVGASGQVAHFGIVRGVEQRARVLATVVVAHNFGRAVRTEHGDDRIDAATAHAVGGLGEDVSAGGDRHAEEVDIAFHVDRAGDAAGVDAVGGHVVVVGLGLAARLHRGARLADFTCAAARGEHEARGLIDGYGDRPGCGVRRELGDGRAVRRQRHGRGVLGRPCQADLRGGLGEHPGGRCEVRDPRGLFGGHRHRAGDGLAAVSRFEHERMARLGEVRVERSDRDIRLGFEDLVSVLGDRHLAGAVGRPGQRRDAVERAGVRRRLEPCDCKSACINANGHRRFVEAVGARGDQVKRRVRVQRRRLDRIDEPFGRVEERAPRNRVDLDVGRVRHAPREGHRLALADHVQVG